MTATIPRDGQPPNLLLVGLTTTGSENTSVVSISKRKQEQDQLDETSTTKSTRTTQIENKPLDHASNKPPSAFYQSTSDTCNKHDLDEHSFVNKQAKQSEQSHIMLTPPTSPAPSPIADEHLVIQNNVTDDVDVHRTDDETANGDSEIQEDEKSNKDVAAIMPDELRPYDILCGRDKETFNNVGNRRFRVSLSLAIPKYLAAKTMSQKAAVIWSMVRMLKDEVGVRFLHRHQHSGSSSYHYVELNDSQARKKLGHALRDMAVSRQQLNLKRSIRAGTQQDDGEMLLKQQFPSSCDDSDDKGTTVTIETMKNDTESDHKSDIKAEDLGDSLSSLLPHIMSDIDTSICDETDMEPLPVFDSSQKGGQVHPPLPHHPQQQYQHHPYPPHADHLAYEQALLKQQQHRYAAAYYYYHFHHHHHFHHPNGGPSHHQPPNGGFRDWHNPEQNHPPY